MPILRFQIYQLKQVLTMNKKQWYTFSIILLFSSVLMFSWATSKQGICMLTAQLAETEIGAINYLSCTLIANMYFVVSYVLFILNLAFAFSGMLEKK